MHIMPVPRRYARHGHVWGELHVPALPVAASDRALGQLVPGLPATVAGAARPPRLRGVRRDPLRLLRSPAQRGQLHRLEHYPPGRGRVGEGFAGPVRLPLRGRFGERAHDRQRQRQRQ